MKQDKVPHIHIVYTVHRTANATFSRVWLKTEHQAQGDANNVFIKRIVSLSPASCLIHSSLSEHDLRHCVAIVPVVPHVPSPPNPRTAGRPVDWPWLCAQHHLEVSSTQATPIYSPCMKENKFLLSVQFP